MLKEDDKLVFLMAENVLTAYNDKAIKSNKVKLLNPLFECENTYMILCKAFLVQRDLSDLRTVLPQVGLESNQNILYDKLYLDSIKMYVSRNKIKNYVVIATPDVRGLYMDAGRIIYVNEKIGLTKANIDQAKSMLNVKIQVSETVLFDWRQKVIDLMDDQNLSWKELGDKIKMDRSNLRKMVLKGNITITTLDRIFGGLDHVLTIDVTPKNID